MADPTKQEVEGIPPAEQVEDLKPEIQVLCEMETGKGKKLIFAKRTYRGKNYFECRQWYQPNDKNLQWYPTQKGFIAPAEKLPEFVGHVVDMAEKIGS